MLLNEGPLDGEIILYYLDGLNVNVNICIKWRQEAQSQRKRCDDVNRGWRDVRTQAKE